MSLIRLAPSLLSADFSRLGEEVRELENSGADLLHFDVMDNHYVPNLTVGPMVCAAIRPWSRLPIDVHLMVEQPDALVPAFARAGADIISFHPEASRHVHRSLALIRDAGCRAGLALCPATPLQWLDDLMSSIDLVLLMSVNPGFGGQSFIDATLDRVRRVRQRIDRHVADHGGDIRLEVDGGINVGNIGRVAAAGADTFVAGSAVFSAADPDGAYRGVLDELRRQAESRPLEKNTDINGDQSCPHRE